MLRLARKREVADVPALLVRVGGTAAQVRTALRRLESEQLVERLDDGKARLTMSGFAIAVASAKLRATAPKVRVATSKPKRVARPRRRVRAA